MEERCHWLARTFLFNFLGGFGTYFYIVSKRLTCNRLQGILASLLYRSNTSNPFLGIAHELSWPRYQSTVITVEIECRSINATPSSGHHIWRQYRDIGHFHHWFQVGNTHYVCRPVCLFFTKNRIANNIGRILFGVGSLLRLEPHQRRDESFEDLPEFSHGNPWEVILRC